ncbi:MAG: integrase, partial [Nitrospira sp.]|nr:integrase [Nitrospira sp.]
STEERRSPWVFPSENPDTHMDPRNFYRRVYLPKVKELGLEGVSWHTLRHTFASRLAMSGATEGTIAALLRHSGTSLVRRYAHLSPSHLQDEVEKVAAFGRVISREVQNQLPTISVPTVTGTVTGGNQ